MRAAAAQFVRGFHSAFEIVAVHHVPAIVLTDGVLGCRVAEGTRVLVLLPNQKPRGLAVAAEQVGLKLSPEHGTLNQGVLPR